MATKMYTIAWASPQGGEPDQHGNMWQTIVLDGYEPKVKILTKNAVNKGDQLYGQITNEESKAGNKYYRFRKEQVPEGQPLPQRSSVSSPSAKTHGSSNQDREDGMAWGNALTNATNLVIAFKGDDVYKATDQIIEIATILFQARGGNVQDETEKTETKLTPAQTGETVLEDIDDEPVDLSDIPF
jgi:hypothetical protein